MKYILSVVIILLALILIYTFKSSSTSPEEYSDEIQKHRKEIDSFMRTDTNSPFRKKGVIDYEGLKYYDIDPDFKVRASVTKLSDPELVRIPMSDGDFSEYYKYAVAEFNLKGESQKVVLLKSDEYWDEDWVFLPFYDETSAKETYGGGRYLEIDYEGGKDILIDFNLAYNPYCAYNDDFNCPFPPRENHITIAVTAGEKIYKAPH